MEGLTVPRRTGAEHGKKNASCKLQQGIEQGSARTMDETTAYVETPRETEMKFQLSPDWPMCARAHSALGGTGADSDTRHSNT